MSSPYSMLLRACQRDSARPRLTWYDNNSAERTELSGATLLNWVNKTANFMIDELMVDPGVSISLDLPRHWLTATWWLASHAVGAHPVVAADGSAAQADMRVAVFGPDTDHQSLRAANTATQCVAVALTAMATGFTGSLPADIYDFESQVRSQPDTYLGTDQGDSAVADQAFNLAARWGLSDQDRVMSAGAVRENDFVRDLLTPLAADASCVWVRNPDATKDVQHAVVERVTATTMTVSDLPQPGDSDGPPIRYLT